MSRPMPDPSTRADDAQKPVDLDVPGLAPGDMLAIRAHVGNVIALR